MKAIYKFVQSAYYAELVGLFIEDDELVDKCMDLKFTVCEKTGKYSEDEIDLRDSLIKISDNPQDVECFERLDLACGFNPFNERIIDSIDDGDIILSEDGTKYVWN